MIVRNTSHDRLRSRPRLTIYAINLDEELLHRSVVRRACPVKGRSVGSDASQGHIGGLGNVHSKDTDEVGCRFPESLPGAMKQPKKG